MTMYEHKKEPLAPVAVYYQRLFRNFLYVVVFLSLCLLIGTVGYRITCDASWIDSFHNASMILSGMGPVITITTQSGKIFSSLYAIFSGVAFITNIGVLLAPAAHRLFHKLHLEE